MKLLKKFESSSSKKHYERKKLNFPTHHIYNVISDVNSYDKFVPWCKESVITSKSCDSKFIANLKIGYGPFQETYTSSVKLIFDPDNISSIKATSIHTNLLEFLETEWTISPAKDKSLSSWITFRIEFKFKSAIYQNITDLFFQDIVEKMVNAFETRCKSLPMKSLP